MPNRISLLGGVALALLLAMPAARADIVIAVAGPMTGQLAAFGGQMKAGAEMAVADINAAGGLLGQKLVLLIGDDACDPKQAVSVANDLVAKKAVFVAGHFCSGSSIPASKVYVDEGVLQISPASTNPKFTDEGGGMVFRVCGRDDQQGLTAGQYLASKFKDKVVAIVHDKTAYGKGLADETQKAMNAAGKKEVLFDAYNAGEKDYSALVSRLKQANVDALYVGGYHPEAGQIVKQMRAQAMKTVLVSGDAIVTDEYWQITGKDGEGTLMTFSPDPRKNAVAKAVVDRFMAKKIDPEGYVLYTYAAIQVFVQAASRVGKTDFKSMHSVMRNTNFATVLGDFTFNAKGDVSLPGYVFYEWKNGKYDYITN